MNTAENNNLQGIDAGDRSDWKAGRIYVLANAKNSDLWVHDQITAMGKAASRALRFRIMDTRPERSGHLVEEDSNIRGAPQFVFLADDVRAPEDLQELGVAAGNGHVLIVSIHAFNETRANYHLKRIFGPLNAIREAQRNETRLRTKLRVQVQRALWWIRDHDRWLLLVAHIAMLAWGLVLLQVFFGIPKPIPESNLPSAMLVIGGAFLTFVSFGQLRRMPRTYSDDRLVPARWINAAIRTTPSTSDIAAWKVHACTLFARDYTEYVQDLQLLLDAIEPISKPQNQFVDISWFVHVHMFPALYGRKYVHRPFFQMPSGLYYGPD